MQSENTAAFLYDGPKLRIFSENISEIDLMLPEANSRGIFCNVPELIRYIESVHVQRYFSGDPDYDKHY